MKAVACHFCSTKLTSYVSLHRGLCADCGSAEWECLVRVCGRCLLTRRHTQRPITDVPGLIPQLRLPEPPRTTQKCLGEFGRS